MLRLTLALFTLAKIVNAQSTATFMGAQGMGMGNASSGIAYEWGLFNNIGTIGLLTEATAATGYHAQSRLPGANRMAFAFSAPLKSGAVALGAFRFGDELYNEHLLSAGYASTFGITTLGAKINCIQYQAQGFGTYTSLSFDVGGITKLSEMISLSASITNLTQSKIGGEDAKEQLPIRLIAGMVAKLSKQVCVTTEIEKDIALTTQWRSGLQYEFKGKFFARTGFNLNPASGFLGVGTIRKVLQADYAVQLNSLTGASHQASITYHFRKRT
ncbi:MAG: hypothetical protein KF775_09760 [Cyclobacteriaceae bacterium]|nr:hypothetical protein [Cyclobacteriaceae bacterium]